MFERYTENARRTIFFARFEASQLGSPFIQTEHLLLGIIREDKKNLAAMLHREAVEQIEGEIRKSASANPQPPNARTDLPLSNESKRVLAYAAEEAERLSDRHIGTEHFFLGLLREKDSLAARILVNHGADLASARKLISETDAASRRDPRRIRSAQPSRTVRIHGEWWDVGTLQDLARPLRRFAWVKQEWQPRDLLIEKNTGRVMFHLGQQFDTERFDLAKAAWPRDHCALCRWELNRTSPDHQIGYTNGMEWVCPECYEHFVAPHIDPRDDLYT